LIAPRYLLDSDTCIYLRRKRPAEVVRRFATLVPGEAVISVIAYGELRYGAAKQGARRSLEALDEFVALIPVQPLPLLAAAAYGELRATLERRGEMIGNNDLWIAAHALTAGLTVVTNNEREFRRVPGLIVENWVAA
jgi:tRNA(fMet)-specific endonuclease VapC